MKRNGLLLFIWIGLSSATAYSQQATNFTISTPGATLNTTLSESSGLEYCRGKLWSHNDSGGEPKIYAVNPADGSITQTITLQGATNVDWEDLAADGYYMYIADTGNNTNGARTNLVIYKINLDDIPLTGDVTIPSNKIETILFYYPEQGTPTNVGNNNTPYDCEAILIRNDVIHLFTKDWTSTSSGYGTSEYLLPNVPHPSGEKYPAKFFHRLDNINFLVTGADNAGVNELVLIGYQNGSLGEHFIRIYSGFQGDDISTVTPYSQSIGFPVLLSPTLGQVEAICFGENPFEGYVSNEAFSYSIFSYAARVKSFSISYSDADKQLLTIGTAGGGIQGEVRYNSERKHLEGFNGLYWVPLDITK
jgi:hypothetical protein